jgi:hypothetical protein
LEGKKTEPNRTEINRFEPVFGLVRFKNLKKNSVWLFIFVQNWTDPKMLSPIVQNGNITSLIAGERGNWKYYSWVAGEW